MFYEGMATINNELELALTLARRASEEIKKIYYGSSGLTIETKSNNTPVTNADKLANEIIVEGLLKAFPNDGIVSEEMASISGGNIRYVDPIDGTKGFIYRSDHFAIHIGRADENGVPIFGLVYKPTTDEFYYGIVGEGAFRVGPNGTRVKLEVDRSHKDKLTLVVNRSFVREHLPFVSKIMPGRDPLQSGGAGLRLIKVLENLADVYIHGDNDYNTWDLCAPHAIAREAGAYVADFDGNPLVYTGQRSVGKSFVVARTEELGKFVAEEFKNYKSGV